MASVKFYSRHSLIMARTAVARDVATIQRQIAEREAAEEDSE